VKKILQISRQFDRAMWLKNDEQLQRQEKEDTKGQNRVKGGKKYGREEENMPTDGRRKKHWGRRKESHKHAPWTQKKVKPIRDKCEWGEG